MEGHALSVNCLAGASGGEEVGLGLDGGRPGARRQVQGGGDAAERVGEGYDRTAVHDAGDGA